MHARRTVLLKVPASFAYRELACRTVAAVSKLSVGAEPGRSTAVVQRFNNELVSAVGEAFNNVVMHAYGGEADGMIELEFSWTRDQVTLEMRDTGASFDFGAVPVLDLDTPHENGMGVHIIRSFVDEATYRPGPPNVLVLKKRLVWSAPAPGDGGHGV